MADKHSSVAQLTGRSITSSAPFPSSHCLLIHTSIASEQRSSGNFIVGESTYEHSNFSKPYFRQIYCHIFPGSKTSKMYIATASHSDLCLGMSLINGLLRVRGKTECPSEHASQYVCRLSSRKQRQLSGAEGNLIITPHLAAHQTRG